MNFLKGMGGGMGGSKGMSGLGASQSMSTSGKSNYFSSLNLNNASKGGEKSKGSGERKMGPPKDFIPQKFALSFDPPCIILQYLNPDNHKRYHHKMSIKKLKKETNTKDALQYLKKKHYHYFIPKIIDQAQIEKLIDKLKLGLPGDEKSEMKDVSQEDFDFDYDDEEFDDL